MIFHINVLLVHKPVQRRCYGRTHFRGVGEGGSECVRGNCIYKLFKLYEMHVVYTCLSIYI